MVVILKITKGDAVQTTTIGLDIPDLMSPSLLIHDPSSSPFNGKKFITRNIGKAT